MNIYVYDKDLNLKHIIDTFNSLIWTRKYNKVGTFELYVPFSPSNLEYLKIGNIIRKDDDLEGAIIEGLEISLDNTGREIIKVTGSFLTNYFSYRLVLGLTQFRGKAEEVIYSILLNNCIDASTRFRRFTKFKMADVKGYTEKVDYQHSYGNMLEEIETICNTSELGFKTSIDLKEKMYLFEVYKGIDRTINQTTIAPCIFSREYENILDQVYTEKDNNSKNVAIIQGEGEGENRKTSYYNWILYEDTERKEIYVDARDLRQIVNDVKMSDEDYIELLDQRGKDKLAEHQKIVTFETNVNTRGNNIYKIDYDLGDLITFQDKKLNLQLDTRITEIQEIYENGKVEINPTFGNSIPTIYDKFKNI